MSVTTLTTPVVTDISPAGSVNSTSVSVFSSVVDLRTALQSLLTFSLNTGTAPTSQCVANILYYHSASGTPPTAASSTTGATGWKTLYSVGSGIVASTNNPFNYRPPSGGYLCIEFTQSGTNTVTCEAFITVIPSATSV